MESLAEYLRNQARWRHTKAEEYPEDGRNLQSAIALESLADLVEDGADEVVSGPVLQALESFTESADSSGALMLGECATREIARYGFGYNVNSHMQHAAMLEELVGLMHEDAYELVRETWTADDGEPADLSPWETEAARDDVRLDSAYFQRAMHMTHDEQEEWIAAARAESA